MITQDMLELVAERTNAIVGINRPSGGPQLSPVWYVWDGEAFWFRIARSTAKYRNVVRDPHISLLILDRAGYRYLAVYGQAQLIETNPADVAAQIVEKYYAPSLARHRLPPADEPEVVTIRLPPERVVAVVEEAAREAACSWSVS